jgi:hypothetical protein
VRGVQRRGAVEAYVARGIGPIALLRDGKHNLGDPKVLAHGLLVVAYDIWCHRLIVTCVHVEDLRYVKEQISGDISEVHVHRRRRVR